MMASSGREDSIPSEVKDKLTSLDSSLTSLENSLQPLLSKPRMELFEKLEPLDMGKIDLVAAYAVNSLFWMYLNVCGINPKEHTVKQELERIRGYMSRVKEIQDKANAPKVDGGAAKRMVRSALWQAAQKKSQTPAKDGAGPSKNSSSGNRKRKFNEDG